MQLSSEKAQPLSKDTPPLSPEQAQSLMAEAPNWSLKDKTIDRTYQFSDFREAIGFVEKVAEIVEREDHHPEILISYNKVRLEFSTHKIGGLSRNDFILAAKINEIG